MDYWSALAELGLSEDGLTRDKVRRTYMRKLRQHPPEKDPEGFKRLRSAFELLREQVTDDEPEPPKPETIVLTASIVTPMVLPEPPKPEPPKPLSIVEYAPLPPLAEVGKPLPLAEVLKRVTTLLDEGDHAEARSLESRWREQHDDHRQVPLDTLARWELVRELLGVADLVPRPIVQILARALRDDPDLTGARTQLEHYRLTHEKEASEANSAFVLQARNLHKQIEGTLWVPKRVEIPGIRHDLDILEEMRRKLEREQHRPPPSRSSGGWLAIAALILGVILVRAMFGSSSPSPSYTTRFRPIEIPEFHLPQIPTLPREALFIPPPMPRLVYRDDTPALMTNQIVESSHVLQNYEISSWQQKEAAVELERAVDRHDCKAMRAAVVKLTAAPATEKELHKAYADMHLDAIKQRLELVCPPRKKK